MTEPIIERGKAPGVLPLPWQTDTCIGSWHYERRLFDEHRDELAERFFAAADSGDLAELEAVLAHDVLLTGDGGGKAPALARSIRGRARVARTLRNWSQAPLKRRAMSRATAW